MAECNKYLNNYLKKILVRAKELAKEEMPQIKREQYEEFFNNGNRLNFETIYFSRREFLTVYGMIIALWQEYSSEESVFLLSCGKRLLNIINSILKEPTWVLPAHGSMDHFDGKIQTIDLFAAETAGSIGEILFLIKEFPFEEQEKKLYHKLPSLTVKNAKSL